ncbi:MAG TPA: oligopeptide transporter, OPT family [Bacillales bacterium]|nr:oligopeptide transporter, OPT family [Bacillales bacterium]
MAKKQQDYVPYISPHKSFPEITVTAIVLGIILAIIFGAANSYLGLVVGMTVSASIPASVISMGILRGIFRRQSILENNIVQTMTTAGEALAAGAVFTIPALFLWNIHPSQILIAFIVLTGGLMGVLMMVPLRQMLIVNEHENLPYPEGTACAEVLKSGETGGVNALNVAKGFAVAGVFKILGDGFKLFKTEIETQIAGFKKAMIGMDTFPALLGVGYIIGPRISGQMIAGGLLAWLVLIPMIGFFGAGDPNAVFPATEAIQNLDPWAIWDNYIRYIGAGAVAVGGLISLVRTLPVIAKTLKDALVGLTKSKIGSGALRTEKDLSMAWVIGGTILILLIIWFAPLTDVGFVGTLAIAVLGFLFVTVSSRIVGIVGTFSDPVSGMTIATLLVIAVTYKAMGFSGQDGMIAALVVAAIVCTALAVAGDTSQDLKTGFLVGSTPWKQQVAMMIGVVASGLVIGFILIVLNQAYGMGSEALPAPKAVLMKILLQGILSGDLPWNLIFIGGAISIVIEFLGLNSLVVAVGIYLPIHTSAPVMLGGAIRWLVQKSTGDQKLRTARLDTGVLFASGLIAGESLIGVVIAILLSAGVPLPDSPMLTNGWLPLLLFLIVGFTLWYAAVKVKDARTPHGDEAQ